MMTKNIFTTLLTCSTILLSSNVFASEQQHNLRVDGITCPFCVATSAKALRKIEGVSDVNANIEEGIISVCASKETELNDEKLTQLFLDKGFKYRGKETIEGCEIK